MAEMECTCRPVHGDHPSTGPVLPDMPVDPGYGIPLPPVVDNGLPNSPNRPNNDLPRPSYPVDPDYDLPVRPGVWPHPPRPPGIDNSLPMPPMRPGFPIYLPPEEVPEPPPGAVWPPLHPALGTEKLLALVWIVGVGYRWTVIDPSLSIWGDPAEKPSRPAKPDQGLPPAAQPKA
jgi:hypothetical protein